MSSVRDSLDMSQYSFVVHRPFWKLRSSADLKSTNSTECAFDNNKLSKLKASQPRVSKSFFEITPPFVEHPTNATTKNNDARRVLFFIFCSIKFGLL